MVMAPLHPILVKKDIGWTVAVRHREHNRGPTIKDSRPALRKAGVILEILGIIKNSSQVSKYSQSDSNIMEAF